VLHAQKKLYQLSMIEVDHVDEVIPGLVGHTLDEVERALILHTLICYGGNRTRSASVLGISIRCLRNKIRKYEHENIIVAAPGRAPANNCLKIPRGGFRAGTDYAGKQSRGTRR